MGPEVCHAAHDGKKTASKSQLSPSTMGITLRSSDLMASALLMEPFHQPDWVVFYTGFGHFYFGPRRSCETEEHFCGFV